MRQAADEAERRRAGQRSEAPRIRARLRPDPSYRMYERASALAGMSGSENPLFRSVDAWSFSVALKRAQAYYPRRLAVEVPADGSVEEQARSALRASGSTPSPPTRWGADTSMKAPIPSTRGFRAFRRTRRR